MSTEQYRVGLSSVVNGSQTVIGASTDWANEVTPPAVFKVDIDGEATYSISTVLTATRLQLSANYAGSTNSGLAYMINRSFTTNRGYWRPQQGDADLADNLSQETIDTIDTDIANILSGTATLSSLNVTGNASINGKLSVGGSLELETNLWVKGNASLDGTLVVAGAFWQKGAASLDSTMNVEDDVQLNSDIWVKGNASIDGTMNVEDDVQLNSNLWLQGNASIDGTLTTGGDTQLDSDLWVKGNASIDGTLTSAGALSGPLKTVVAATTDTLTAAQCRGTRITNQGQGIPNTQTLPTGEDGLNSIVSLETIGAGAFHLKAGPDNKIYLDGTAQDNGDKVTLGTPAAGNYFTFFTFRNGGPASYDYIVEKGRGELYDGGA